MKGTDILGLVVIGVIAYKFGEAVGKKLLQNTEGGKDKPLDTVKDVPYRYKSAGYVEINGGYSC